MTKKAAEAERRRLKTLRKRLRSGYPVLADEPPYDTRPWLRNFEHFSDEVGVLPSIEPPRIRDLAAQITEDER